MINLQVDEAYAFDYLSILDIKRKKSPTCYEAWRKCYMFLQNQFDYQKWLLMISSEEYNSMLEANEATFIAVDKAKNNEVTAQHVDRCNYMRYVAKQKFQKKFFSDNLSEFKLGYEKYAHNSASAHQG